jgi:hypothetical protein
VHHDLAQVRERLLRNRSSQLHATIIFASSVNTADEHLLLGYLAPQAVHDGEWAGLKVRGRRRIVEHMRKRACDPARQTGFAYHVRAEVVLYAADGSEEPAILVHRWQDPTPLALTRLIIRNGQIIRSTVRPNPDVALITRTGFYPPES